MDFNSVSHPFYDTYLNYGNKYHILLISPGKRDDKHFKTAVMKNNLHLIASVDRPEMLEDIIEELATRRYDIGYGKAKVPTPWQAMDTSSVEAYVSGSVGFDYDETQRIGIPYVTGFIFTCTKEKNAAYFVKWSMSLS